MASVRPSMMAGGRITAASRAQDPDLWWQRGIGFGWRVVLSGAAAKKVDEQASQLVAA